MSSRALILALVGSKSVLSALVVADANDLINAREKNLAVTDVAGASSHGNCLHNFLNHRISDHQLDLDLGNKIDGVFPSSVKLGVPLLSSMPPSLKHSHAFDANLVQRTFYAFQLGDLDDCFDFGHRDSYNPTPNLRSW